MSRWNISFPSQPASLHLQISLIETYIYITKIFANKNIYTNKYSYPNIGQPKYFQPKYIPAKIFSNKNISLKKYSYQIFSSKNICQPKYIPAKIFSNGNISFLSRPVSLPRGQICHFETICVTTKCPLAAFKINSTFAILTFYHFSRFFFGSFAFIFITHSHPLTAFENCNVDFLDELGKIPPKKSSLKLQSILIHPPLLSIPLSQFGWDNKVRFFNQIFLVRVWRSSEIFLRRYIFLRIMTCFLAE